MDEVGNCVRLIYFKKLQWKLENSFSPKSNVKSQNI